MGMTAHFRVAVPEAVGQGAGVLEEIMRFVAEQYLTSCQTLEHFLRQLDGRPQQRHNLLGSSDLLGVLIRIPAFFVCPGQNNFLHHN